MATAATTKVSMRLPNSMALCTPIARCGTNDWPEKRGHVGQPSPDPVSRTPPPVTTTRTLTTTDATAAGRIQRVAHDRAAVRDAGASVWVTSQTISAAARCRTTPGAGRDLGHGRPGPVALGVSWGCGSRAR